MEMQTNIFDFLDDKELTIYDKCLVPGIQFSQPKENIRERHPDMKAVVDEKTGKHLFLASIEPYEDDPSNLSFFYQALDGYWGGSYATRDKKQIKRSLFRLSNEISKELEEEEHAALSSL